MGNIKCRDERLILSVQFISHNQLYAEECNSKCCQTAVGVFVVVAIGQQPSSR